MKVKCAPEDFVVEELTEFPLSTGPFSFYRMSKIGLGTPEAMDAILRRWNLPREKLQYGGLKDRHAQTTQYLTIRHGPRRGFRQEHLHLEYLGAAPRPFGPRDIQGNRFRIALRDLSESVVEQLARAADELPHGVPNYFDDQRFGSFGASRRWIAEPWCKGDYEQTLWLALADANLHDRPDVRQRKELLREKWGDWDSIRQGLDRSNERSIVTYLTDHPTDHRGAVARLRRDMRSIYVAAFQSMLWNHILAKEIEDRTTPEERGSIGTRLGPMPVPARMPVERWQELERLRIPLPAARQKDLDPHWEKRIAEVLAPFQMERRELRLKYPRDTFFSKGDRPALFFPRNVSAMMAPDDRYEKRWMLRLEFDLPRGAYATMALKRLLATARTLDAGMEEEPVLDGDEDSDVWV